LQVDTKAIYSPLSCFFDLRAFAESAHTIQQAQLGNVQKFSDKI